ncbi:MAG: AsmA family protein [Chromatiales bacterium]
MKKFLKILLSVLLVLVIAVGAAAVILPRVIDPNDYKEQIAAQVKKATGRELTLTGDLKLTVFPWLGVNTGAVALGNAPGFGEEPMFSADQVGVRVKLLPLLLNNLQIELDTVITEGLTVNLVRDKSGKTNFDDLKGKQADSDEPKGAPLAAAVLNGLDLRNSAITWDDQSRGEKYSVTSLNLQTGTLALDESVPLSLSTNFDASPKGVAGNVDMKGEIEISQDLKHVQITPIDLTGKLNGKAIPGGASDVKLKGALDLDLNAGTLKLDDLDFAGFGTEARGSVDASDWQGDKPKASGAIALSSADLPALITLAMDLLPEQTAARLAPLTKLGEDAKAFKLSSSFDVDMTAGHVKLDGLDFTGLGAEASGNIDASNLQDGKPKATGKIALHTGDLPALAGLLSSWIPPEQAALMLKPYQSQPGLSRDVKLDATFDVDMQSGLARFSGLSLNALSTDVKGDIDASNVQSGKPVAAGKIDVVSANGPAVIAAFTGKQLPATAKELKLSTAFNVDLGAGTAKLGDLAFTGLDSNVKGNIDARNLAGGKPAASGTIALHSANAPELIKALTGKALPPGSGKELKVNSTFSIDLAAGSAKFENLDAVGLGSQLRGNLDARDIQSKQPAVAGNIALTSNNGPALVSLATGKPVPNAAGDLKLNTAMNVDLKAGYAQLKGLSLETLGTKVSGDVDARGINAKDSSVTGKLNVSSPDVSALLKAYGQADLPVQVSNLNAVANISGSAQKFRLDPINASATVTGAALPAGANDFKLNTKADVDLGKDTLSMSDLSFAALGLNATGSVNAIGLRTDPKLSGKLNVGQFNLRQLLTTLGKADKLPVMADPDALSKVAITSAFNGSTKDIALNGMTLQLDDSKVTGDLAVASIANPAITFNLAIDAINADRYLAPREEGEGEGKATPTADASAAVTQPAASKLPLDTLRKLKVKGDAKVGRLTVRNAKLANVRLAINARDGDVQLNPIAANLYEGSYNGAMAVNAKGQNAVLNMDHSLTGVQVEPLLKDMKGKARLRGKGDFSLHAKGSGTDSLGIKRTLNGQGAFAFRNGAIKGFNIGKILRSAKAGFIGRVDPNEETDFTELTGTYTITNGVVSNEDLAAKSPLLRVEGQGKADLASEKIDYVINATLVASAEGQGGKELVDLSGVAVPIKVSGTFDDPSFAPDVAGIAKARAEKELQRQLEKQGDKLPDPAKQLLEGVLGGKKKAPASGGADAAAPPPGEATAPAKAAPPPEEVPPPPPPKPEEQVEKALKDLLNF